MSVAQISHYTILVEHACDTRCVYFGSDGTKNASMACIVGRQLPTSKLRSIAIQSSSATMNVATDEISSAPCIDSVGNVNKSDIRIWMDGAFDMMHYGHMNAFRQAKALGTTLVVGVNNDESITVCKGKPVTSEEERMETVRGCKWVDEIVTDVPYIMNEEYLRNMIHQHRIDFVVHGDDPCLVDGKDVYETAQKLGKYLTIPRTEGISTTAIVGRILNHLQRSSEDSRAGAEASSSSSASRNSEAIASLFLGKSSFLTTANVVRTFSENIKAPLPGARVVYIAGTWDLLHAGHLSVLEKARASGDYLIVGIYSDPLASVLHARSKGRGRLRDGSSSGRQGAELDQEALCDHTYPILSMEERMLSILGCKYVDDVLVDAPYVLSSDLLSSLRISVVLTDCGASSEGSTAHHPDIPPCENGTSTGMETKEEESDDHNKIPKEKNILRVVSPTFSITAEEIMDRILKQEEKFKKKFAAKRAQEDEYYAALYVKRNQHE